MTKIIAYRGPSNRLALLRSDKTVYWIGVFDPRMTHQNGEPLYYCLDGYYKTEGEGLMALEELRGDEF